MKPLVSAIIPNYNYARFVGEAVESALRQTYQPLEIIVVDDGSPDNSLEILRGFGDKVIVIAQENSGVSAARNNGVRSSSGELLAFLDADDVWYPRKIEKQVERFEQDSKLGLVHVGVREVDASGNELVTRLDGLEGDVSSELLRFDRTVILGGGSGLMVPKNVFDEIGGFDLRLSTSADWDFFYQVTSRYRTGFVPELLLDYRMHGSNMHGNIRRMEKEMLLGFDKAFSGRDAAIKHECYGNLHRTLAGSFLRANDYGKFAEHAVKSIWRRPSGIGYFLGFPVRRLKGAKSNKQ